MRAKSTSRVLFAASLLYPVAAIAGAALPRISSEVLDLGAVHRVYLSPGLVSVLELPTPITEVKVGSPGDINAIISKTLPSELTLSLKRSLAHPTNLIVRCGVRSFVFDLIPSETTHQDLIRVSGAYGGPEDVGLGATLIDSSRAAARREPGGMVLIESSRSKGGGS